MAPSRELALAVECCRHAFTRGEAALPEVGADVDWPLFLRTVRFHRVQGLAWDALAQRRDRIPAPIADALADDAVTIAAANLRSTAECGRLLEDFDRAKVTVLFLKGATLGALAYGNASIKAAIDIDLLVTEEEIVEAAELLRQRGYQLRYPHAPPTPKRLRAWHGERKESVWSRTDEPSYIDLHTRLSDNRALIPSLDVSSPRQAVAIAQHISLPTLATEELFAYLCVHGASSAWFRLKWIADFAALLHGRTEGEIDRLYRRSQELGAGRAAAQALLLADALFQSLAANTQLRQEVEDDPASKWLFRAAMRQLTKIEPVEPTSQTLGTATIHLTQFALLPGMKFKLSEFARQARSALWLLVENDVTGWP